MEVGLEPNPDSSRHSRWLQSLTDVKLAEALKTNVTRRKQSKGRKTCMHLVKQVYDRTGLNHIVLLGVLMVYGFIGALVFQYFEAPFEREQLTEQAIEMVERRQNFSMDLIALIRASKCRRSNLTCQQEELYALVESYEITHFDVNKTNLYQWDLWNALFYAGTIFTTIGYGHMHCRTFWGQMATIVYATIGIPLFLAVLNDFGACLLNWTKAILSCVRRQMKKSKARIQQQTTKYLQVLTDEAEVTADVDLESEQTTPWAVLLFAVVAVFVYMFICAAIFNTWEKNWSFFKAFYFFFISLSTIGLGDIVPDHPRYTLAGFAFILVGLSLVSLCINLLQSRIEDTYRQAFVNVQAALLQELASNLEMQSTKNSAEGLVSEPTSPGTAKDQSSAVLRMSTRQFKEYAESQIRLTRQLSLRRSQGSFRQPITPLFIDGVPLRQSAGSGKFRFSTNTDYSSGAPSPSGLTPRPVPPAGSSPRRTSEFEALMGGEKLGRSTGNLPTLDEEPQSMSNGTEGMTTFNSTSSAVSSGKEEMTTFRPKNQT